MSSEKNLAERREYKRLEAQEGAFAAMRGPVSKLGQIIDISKSGLAFRYIDTGVRPDRSFDLDISLTNNGFHLEDVPCKNISDSEITNEFHFSSITMRRLGVQFAELTHKQTSQLEYFIQNHTMNEI
ncbi:MAG: PilZ domain-containing protein [Deltaproteobacteria bacterium]|nr:PilZ domain-containing protein [Deltaproteobacteria bacterium]MBW2117484.1 PilZ domain-containing protein [Deltaproteobacteria bacterium]